MLASLRFSSARRLAAPLFQGPAAPLRALHSTGAARRPQHEGAMDLDTSASQSVTADEVQKFASVSSEWWDPEGAFKHLHTMNRTRVSYIRDRLADLAQLPVDSKRRMSPAWLANKSAVDVGCGGGLASESLARIGMQVTGIDAGRENVAVARIHARSDPSLNEEPRSLVYRQMTAEQLVEEGKLFDAVVSLEVIEHVRDPVPFVKSLVDLAKPGAPIFISTMNRTLLSLFVDIIIPEYVMGSVPKGTHEHDKFIAPGELSSMLKAFGATTLDVQGLILDPVCNQCHLAPANLGLLRNAGVQANYILAARKNQ
ncbi:ubiquinone biosynthesis O-methyltransferase [Martensiomyces pterosporus]|nr:ubiquinone biosynthesis O-methyltransferase [Martensiomyces pterosporus]